MTERPIFDMREHAQKAAEAMLDSTLTYEQKARVTNPAEVDQMNESEYREYQQLMITFMREIRKGE